MADTKGAKRAREIVPDRADDFAKAFYALKMVFAKYEKYLHVNADTREKYYLETRLPSYKGKPLFFGAVVRGRGYVSVHLMPLDWEPSLAKGISAVFKKRVLGQPRFNFLVVGVVLFVRVGRLPYCV